MESASLVWALPSTRQGSQSTSPQDRASVSMKGVSRFQLRPLFFASGAAFCFLPADKSAISIRRFVCLFVFFSVCQTRWGPISLRKRLFLYLSSFHITAQLWVEQLGQESLPGTMERGMWVIHLPEDSKPWETRIRPAVVRLTSASQIWQKKEKKKSPSGYLCSSDFWELLCLAF